MAFDILIHIPENTQRGRVIQKLADEGHLTIQQVVEQILEAGIQARDPAIQNSPNGKTPAEILMGLFCSPEDAALMDEVTSIAYEGRNTASTRDIGL